MSYDPLWNGLKPCRECGAPLLDRYPPERARGSCRNPDVPLNAYEAQNLLEALKLVPNTGDWHGQLRSRCEEVIKKYPQECFGANATAEMMRKMMR